MEANEDTCLASNDQNQLNFTNPGGLWTLWFAIFFLFLVVVPVLFPLNFVCINPKCFWIFNLNKRLHTIEWGRGCGSGSMKSSQLMLSLCQPQFQARVACSQQICSNWHCDIKGSYCEQHSCLFGEDVELGMKRPFRLELISFFCKIEKNMFLASLKYLNFSF